MGLLKFIFFALLFYYGFKFLARLFAPFLIKKVADTKNSVKEGETIIDKAPKNSTQSKNSVGEYVDFEEID